MMTRMRALSCLIVLVALGACKKSAPEPTGEPEKVAEPAKPTAGLSAVPAKDLVGYLSGNYHNGSNNPAMYADLDRKVFVMMGERAAAEVPFDKPAEATAAFEKFLVLHGYAANGTPPTDDHQKIMVAGKEMVVMPMDELMPEMPAELKAKFTTEQYSTLYKTNRYDGYAVVAVKYPIIWAYAETLVVQGKNPRQEFPIEKATDALAAFGKLLAH